MNVFIDNKCQTIYQPNRIEWKRTCSREWECNRESHIIYLKLFSLKEMFLKDIWRFGESEDKKRKECATENQTGH